MATKVHPNTGNVGAGGELGYDGSKYPIDVRRVDGDLFTIVEENTADGDSEPVFDGNLELYGRLDISGLMTKGAVTGAVLYLKTGTTIDLTITLQTNKTLVGKFIIERMMFRWVHNGVNVPVRIVGRYTDDAISETDT